MPAENKDFSLSPRLTTGKDAESPGRSSGLAKPPSGWNSWNPVGSAPRRRSEASPPTVRPRQGSVTAHACEWHEYPGSDDFAGCWA